jgi:RimJ/RimL family protein N-acetyltransferase
MNAVLSVVCDEPEGKVTRHVYPLMFTPENLVRFYEAASQFPVLFGKPIASIEEFLSYVLTFDKDGIPSLNGAFWVVDDFVGVLYLTNISERDADAHFAFFDKRFRGRHNLIKGMLRHVFQNYGFRRLSAQLPEYIGKPSLKFVSGLGFSLEGKKRDAARYHDKDFGLLLYGILASEVDRWE